MLDVHEPRALNCCTLFHLILLIINISMSIQESNFNSSCFFRIPGFFVLRSDRTQFRSAFFLSIPRTHARGGGGIIILVRQGLSFSELCTSYLSSLDSYSDYVKVNISQNNSSSLSLLNIYALHICFTPTDSRTKPFSFFTFAFARYLFNLWYFKYHQPLWDSRGTSDPRSEEVFDWIIFLSSSSPQ